MDIIGLNLQHVGPPSQDKKPKKPQHEIIRERFGFTKVKANPKRRNKRKRKR